MIKVNVTGLKELEARLKNAPEKIRREVDAEVQEGAREFALRAKQSASSQFGDKGVLAAGIQPENRGLMNAFVFSNAKYSAYIEWGTITKVLVPAELQEYAIQFKGKGLRTTGGISPRPYFFRHTEPIQQLIMQRIRAVLDI